MLAILLRFSIQKEELDITVGRLLKLEEFVVIQGRKNSQEVDRVYSKSDLIS